MKLLYGKPVADRILNRLKGDILSSEKKPRLDVILVGADKASQLYVRLKEKTAREIGMEFFLHKFEENISENFLLQKISELNNNFETNGIIVQLPLPKKFETDKIISTINPKKDVDGFHPVNTEMFLKNDFVIEPVFPRAIVYLVESAGEVLENKKGIVIANSDEFGKIMCSALDKKDLISEYILAGTISSNLGKIKGADVVVSAVGSPGLLRGEMFKEGIIIVDGGIEKVGDKVFGDVDFASTKEKAGFITPVPGGVGPVTIACLLENTYLAFKAQQKGE